MLLSPHHQEPYLEALAEGFAREGARRTADDFEVAATVPMLISDDVEAAADALRHYYALYFGGMGAKGKNFHANVPIRMGYGDMVETVQDLYLSGKKQEAAEAIPFELIDQMSLIGPPDKIRHDLEAWRDSFVTTLLIGGDVGHRAHRRRARPRLAQSRRPMRPLCDQELMSTRNASATMNHSKPVTSFAPEAHITA